LKKIIYILIAFSIFGYLLNSGKSISLDEMIDESLHYKLIDDYEIVNSYESNILLNIFGYRQQNYKIRISENDYDLLILSINNSDSIKYWKLLPVSGLTKNESAVKSWERISSIEEYGLTTISKFKSNNTIVNIYYY